MLVYDITTCLDMFNSVVINHIFKQDNSAADWLVKLGLSLHATSVWDVVPYRDLRHILFGDNLEEPLSEGLPRFYFLSFLQIHPNYVLFKSKGKRDHWQQNSYISPLRLSIYKKMKNLFMLSLIHI